ncbi:unnamed protein product [Lota lota]
MDIVDTLNHLTPSDQLDSLAIGQNLECEARNELGTGILLEDSLKNMLSDKDPMFGSASSQFNPLDNEDGNFLIAGATGLDGLSGALPCPPATPVKRSVGRPRKHPRVTPPAETVAPEASTTPTPSPVNSKPRGRPRKKPTNRQLSSFLIEKGIRGSQLKKELCLGGRVHIQDLDAGLWLNPVVVLRRLTVTVGGFRIELLPGPSYDTAGGADAGQAVSLQDGLTHSGDVACAMDIKDDDATPLSPTTENQIGSGGVEEDVPLGLGPYVNPNDVQATNGTPAPNSCSEETKVDNGSVSAKQTPSTVGKDVVKPTQNLPNDTTGSTDKVDCKDKLKLFAKAMLKPKPRLPTVKNKSLVSRRPKSQIKEPNPPPSSPTKPPEKEDVTHHAKSPKEKKGVVSLKRPGEISQPEHASKVLKVQTGKPANPKPKSPGPSSSAPVRKTPSCDGHADPHDVPKNALAPNPKPERTPPSLGSPGPSSRPLEDGGQEKPKGKKPDKLLQRQKSKTARAVSVEEPPLFVPDNAPAAAKKESADEQPAESAWDGTNSCGLCKKHHGNMFMVGCGRCDDWFHGDCVGLDLAKVQEMEEEDQMYVCLKCCAEESVKAEPEVQRATKRPAPPEVEAVPEAVASTLPAKPRQGPPQALASGGVRPMKKEPDRRQSTEVKESSHKTGMFIFLCNPKHKGSSSAPKKPASAEEIRRSVRDSLKEILLQRLKESDLKMAVERASEVARKTERELFYLYKDTDSKYKSKYRSLMFNLRDSKNNVLFRRVLKGDISPANLSRMSPEELASKELAAWRQRENRHAIEMIEKDQREVERRPITKITHKGEIEIESEEPVKAAEAAESPSPTKVLDLVADLLPLEQKAESRVKVDKDTTGQHKSHLFDLHCKICTGRMAPPVEEAPTKVVKVATTVAKRPSAAAEETTKGVTTTTTTKEDNLHLTTVLEESLRNTGSSEARSSFTYTSAKDDGVSFLSTLQCMWRGFVNMAAVAKLVTRAFPVSGVLDHLTEDLPDSVQVGGRINPQLVWDYFDKIRATGTKEVCLIRFSPETEEDEISYTLLYAYFSSRKRFGVVSNNLKQVRDMYIIPLGATEKVPHQLVPFDGPGLENNRPNLLLGLIIRQRPKRDFLPVDVNETAAIIPQTKPLPVPAMSTRLPEAVEEEEEEEEAAAKKYLSSLIPTKKAKETEKPVGAPKAEEKAAEPVAEPVEDEASVEEGEQGSESNKPLRFLPGVLLGWGGELPPLPDFGTKPPPPPLLEDPRTAKPTAKSPTAVLRLDRFVIRKREPKPAAVEAAPPGASGDNNSSNNNNRPAAQRALHGTGLAAWPGAGVSLREKPPEVSTEAYLASLSSPPPNGKDADKKEDASAAAAAAAAANVSTEPKKESAEGTLSPPARSQTESPKAPLSGILKKSSVYSSAVEDNGLHLPPTATLTPLPIPAQSSGQNQSGAGSPPAVTPLPKARAPSVTVGIGSSFPSEKTKDPRVPQVVSAATAAACRPGPHGDRPEPQMDWPHCVPAATASNSGANDDVTGAPPGQLASQGPDGHGGDGSRPLPEEGQTPPAQQQQNHSDPALNTPPASHTPPSLQQDAPTEPAGRPSPSPSTTGIKDYKRPEDRYSDPWERPRHVDERDRDHHHRGHHSDKKGRHQDRHRERSRHRGHSEERRKERHRGDEHGGRHKERHRHRRDSDHENGRRSSRDSY